MEPKDRIIVALDVDRPERAIELVGQLAPHVGCFKIGLEFMSAMLVRLGAYDWEASLTELRAFQRLFTELGDKIFWDGKFMDIPNTVAGASRPISSFGVKMFNVHCLGGAKMMKAAKDAAEEMKIVSPTGTRPLVLGVTVLTSLSAKDLLEMGFDYRTEIDRASVRHIVHRLMRLGIDAGLDGFVCSSQEAVFARWNLPKETVLVTPGIRSADAPPDDQKRTMTPGEAVKAGADYLVIGRPITKAASPADAAKRIAEEISEAFKGAA